MITYEKFESVQQPGDAPDTVPSGPVEPFIRWTVATVDRLFAITPELSRLTEKTK